MFSTKILNIIIIPTLNQYLPWRAEAVVLGLHYTKTFRRPRNSMNRGYVDGFISLTKYPCFESLHINVRKIVKVYISNILTSVITFSSFSQIIVYIDKGQSLRQYL